MRTLFYIISITIAMVWSSVAMAQQFDGPHADVSAMSDGYFPSITYGTGTTFSVVSMNATRTMDAVRTHGWRFLRLNMVFVYATADRAVTMYCEESEDKSTWFRTQILSGTTASGTVTSYDETWSKTPGASGNWPWTVALNAYPYVRCVFAVASGSTSNKLSVTGEWMD